ncbi:hypothetical protein KAH27_05870, partial [bacterium]|nr:hypothetical protein [bacterium]
MKKLNKNNKLRTTPAFAGHADHPGMTTLSVLLRERGAHGPRITFFFLIAFLLSSTNLMAGTILDEKFESWPPEDWQIVNNGGSYIWTNYYSIHTEPQHTGGDGDCANADSKTPGGSIDSSLITPPIDMSGVKYGVLYFDTSYYAYPGANFAKVDISTNSGIEWINLLHWQNESYNPFGPGTNVAVNISKGAGCSNLLIRFHYYGDYDFDWEIDNVVILTESINPTDFKAKSITKNQINLSWVTNEVGDEVILARNLSDDFGTPADETTYNIGNNIGSSSVIYVGDGIAHSDSNFVSEATEYFYKIWSVNSDTQYSSGVTAKSVSCVGTFPYMEPFETDFGAWRKVGNIDFEWTRQSGGTPSLSTGPTAAFDGDYYIYTDAKGPVYYNKSFLIEADFDFSESLNPELAFFYHMFGSTMGNLYVDVLDETGVWHSNIWEKSGQQQSSSDAPWKGATVELQKFGEQSPVKIRFRGVTGNGYYSDMSVDYITITNRPGNLFFNPKTQTGSGHPGTIVQYDISALNLTETNLDFNLTYTGFGGGAGWNENGPANTGVIIYRNSTNFSINVTIDPNAAADEAHTSIVISVSVDGVFTNSTEIITKCDWHYDIYSENFNAEFYWPFGWSNYFLGQVGEGWYYGIKKHLFLFAPTHDPASGATNWFVSPGIDFDTEANQIYLSFYFMNYSDPYVPMKQKQSVYVSTGSRNPNDGDYFKVDDIDFGPNNTWSYHTFDLSAFHGHSNVYIAIDYTSGNPMIAFDVVEITGNKTGVENAELDSPTSFSIDSYQSTPAVTGSIFIVGSTGTSGPAVQVTAQFGYGFKNTMPFDNNNWKWVDAIYSYSDDTRDYFISDVAVPTVSGEIDYAFRFKNGFSSWVYADTDGSSNGYSKSAAGEMMVNMLPPIGELVKEQTLPTTILGAYASVNNTLYDYTVADDFEFTVDTDINSIRWEAIYWNAGRTGYETGIVVKIYQNSSSGGENLPDSVLYSEFVPGYSCEQIVNAGTSEGENIYKYHVDLATTFEAAENTKYWFSVQMVVPVQNEFWGQLVTPDSVSGVKSAQSDSSSWWLLNDDNGFELYGEEIPEPFLFWILNFGF